MLGNLANGRSQSWPLWITWLTSSNTYAKFQAERISQRGDTKTNIGEAGKWAESLITPFRDLSHFIQHLYQVSSRTDFAARRYETPCWGSGEVGGVTYNHFQRLVSLHTTPIPSFESNGFCSTEIRNLMLGKRGSGRSQWDNFERLGSPYLAPMRSLKPIGQQSAKRQRSLPCATSPVHEIFLSPRD